MTPLVNIFTNYLHKNDSNENILGIFHQGKQFNEMCSPKNTSLWFAGAEISISG
jgi:hypothetical protein